MKKLILLLLITVFAQAQNPTRNIAGFGAGFTANDMASTSIFEARSTVKGVLFPRMTTTQRNTISSPATSLWIYNTTTSAYNYYNGSSWVALGGSGVQTVTGDLVDNTDPLNPIVITPTLDQVIVQSGNETRDNAINFLTTSTDHQSLIDSEGIFVANSAGYIQVFHDRIQRYLLTGGANTSIMFTTPTGAGTLLFPNVVNATKTLATTDQINNGTVTSVSVVSANGITGSVATSTTTPAITLSLGAITPTTIVASSTISGSNLSGTNTGDQTTITGNSGTATALQTPRTIGTITGDATSSGSTFDGSANNTNAITVTKINGTSLAGLSTGILKNTTTTGVPSIAVAADFPTLNQNTTGNAATVTTNANLTGVITSSGNTTSITSQTGTGTKFVVDNTPTLITPVIGVATGTSLTLTGSNTVGTTGGYIFSGWGGIKAGSDGNFYFVNSSGSATGRLGWGGLTSNDPAIQRNGASFDFVTGNNNAFITFRALGYTLTGQSTTFAPDTRTSGTLTTTIAGGRFGEYNGSYYSTTGALNRFANGGKIYGTSTDVSNTSTTETDLITYTTKASTLGATDESLVFDIAGTLNDITATADLKFYFGGTSIGDTGVLTISATGGWTARIVIVRSGSTTAKAMVTVTTPGASTAQYTTVTSLTGLTFTGTNILKCTGTAGGAGGGTGDITASVGQLLWWGASAN